MLQSSSGIRVPIGLYSNEVTYFFLNLCVVLKTMTPSLMDSAYKWFNITWLGSGRRVGSQDIGVSWRLKIHYFFFNLLGHPVLTLFKMTCKRCGGKIGGPDKSFLLETTCGPISVLKCGISCPNTL